MIRPQSSGSPPRAGASVTCQKGVPQVRRSDTPRADHEERDLSAIAESPFGPGLRCPVFRDRQFVRKIVHSSALTASAYGSVALLNSPSNPHSLSTPTQGRARPLSGLAVSETAAGRLPKGSGRARSSSLTTWTPTRLDCFAMAGFQPRSITTSGKACVRPATRSCRRTRRYLVPVTPGHRIFTSLRRTTCPHRLYPIPEGSVR